MLADGTDKISGEIFILVYVSTDLADPSLGRCGRSLWLYRGVIKGVGHTLFAVKAFAFLHGAKEKDMGGKNEGVLHLQGEKCIGILAQNGEIVFTATVEEALHFVNVFAALKAETLEKLKGSGFCQDVDVQLARTGDYAAGMVGPVDSNCKDRRIGTDLGNGVDHKSAVLSVFTGGDDVKTVADGVQCFAVFHRDGIVFVLKLKFSHKKTSFEYNPIISKGGKKVKYYRN